MSRKSATCGFSDEVRHRAARAASTAATTRSAPASCELARGRVVGRAGDDDEVGPRGARGERDVEVLLVGVDGGDERRARARCPPPRGRRPRCRPRCTTSAPLDCAAATDSGVTSTTTYGRARSPELGRDAAADAAEAADDHVVAELVDRPFSSVSRPKRRPDDPARDHVHDHARDVEEDCHAAEEEDDGEDLRPPSLSGARVEAGQRRRDDRAVERRDPALVRAAGRSRPSPRAEQRRTRAGARTNLRRLALSTQGDRMRWVAAATAQTAAKGLAAPGGLRGADRHDDAVALEREPGLPRAPCRSAT